MESEIKEKKTFLVDPNHMEGKWKLTYKLENALKADGFSGRMLGPYEHPVTHKTVHLLNGQNRPIQLGFWIDKLVTYLVPHKIENLADYNAVMFLLGHPEVKVEGLPIGNDFNRIKNSNPKVTLVNMDFERSQEIDEQEIIDQMIGRLSLDRGKDAVGLERLQYLLAAINKPFTDRRYINDPQQLKKRLRTEVKDFVREGKKNAEIIEYHLNNIENAKKAFVIKSLLNTGDVVYTSGSYKFVNGSQSDILGANLDMAIDHLKTNPEMFSILMETWEKRKQEQESPKS